MKKITFLGLKRYMRANVLDFEDYQQDTVHKINKLAMALLDAEKSLTIQKGLLSLQF